MCFTKVIHYLGKGGSSIQKLRAEHPRTIIQIPDCASPERILIISGEYDQCFDALQQINSPRSIAEKRGLKVGSIISRRSGAQVEGVEDAS